MTIAFIIYGTIEGTSGGYLYDRKLIQAIEARGHKVEIYSQTWSDSYRRRCIQDLHHKNDSPKASPLWNLLHQVKAGRIDIILEDELNHPSLTGWNRLLQSEAPHIPRIGIIHHLAMDEAYISQPIHPLIPLGPRAARERKFLASIDGFIANTKTSRDRVLSLMGNIRYLDKMSQGKRSAPLGTPGWYKTIVCLPGREGAFPPEQITTRSTAAKNLPPQNEDFILCFLGSITPRKGLVHCIRALALCKRSTDTTQSTTKLRIIGDPTGNASYTKKCLKLIRRLNLGQQVEWLGYLSHQKLAETLASSHLFILPSRVEGFGIAYLDAQGFALPCLAAQRGGAAEAINPGVSGQLVPWNKPKILAQWISHYAGFGDRATGDRATGDRATGDRATRDRAGTFYHQQSQAALANWASKPSWGQSMDAGVDFLEGLITRSGTAPSAGEPGR